MTTGTTTSTMQREPTLLGQTVVVIGGSAGIGLETSRLERRLMLVRGTIAPRPDSPHPGPGRVGEGGLR